MVLPISGPYKNILMSIKLNLKTDLNNILAGNLNLLWFFLLLQPKLGNLEQCNICI